MSRSAMEVINLHCGQLGVSVVGGRNLDDISPNEVDTVKTTDNRSNLTSRPPASLGCSGGRGNCSNQQLKTG